MKRPNDTVKARMQFYQDLEADKFSLSETVRRMRKIIGMNQIEYAKFVGIAPRVLMDFERGTGNPTLQTLGKIGAPFGLTVLLRRVIK